MGTAGTDKKEQEAAEASLAERKGKIINAGSKAANACHSFEEWEGSGAGTTGAELLAGFAQQAGVEQLWASQPVRQQPDFPSSDVAPLVPVRMPWHARTNANRRTVAAFIVRDVMVCNESP